MRVTKAVSALMMLVLVGVVAKAADKKPATQPIDWSTTMPSIELAHQPLEKVLREMKAKLPGFDFSISRTNVAHDQPILPAISIENVTLYQFAQLLIEQIQGLQINDNSFSNNNADFWRVYVKSNSVVEAPAPPPTIVRVFGLTEVIEYRASLITGDGDHEKQSADDVLSVVQAALDELDSTVRPSLKIHQQTKTLICKVTTDQAQVIEETIAALRPSDAERTEMQKRKAEQEHERIRAVEQKKVNDDVLQKFEFQLAEAKQTLGKDNPKVKLLEARIAEAKQQAATQPSK